MIIENLKIWVCGNVYDLFSRDRVRTRVNICSKCENGNLYFSLGGGRVYGLSLRFLCGKRVKKKHEIFCKLSRVDILPISSYSQESTGESPLNSKVQSQTAFSQHISKSIQLIFTSKFYLFLILSATFLRLSLFKNIKYWHNE